MIYLGNGMYSESGPSDQLMHYGVLGMKWGVRKARNVAYAQNDLEYRKRRIQLANLRKAGVISKEEYKKGKKTAKTTKKYQNMFDKNTSKKLSESLANDIRNNRDKYKGKKIGDIKRSALALQEKQHPGFGRYYNAYGKLKRQRVINSIGIPLMAAAAPVGFATLGAGRELRRSVNAYKDPKLNVATAIATGQDPNSKEFKNTVKYLDDLDNINRKR